MFHCLLGCFSFIFFYLILCSSSFQGGGVQWGEGALGRCATIATATSYQTKNQWWSPNLTFWLCYLRPVVFQAFSGCSQSFLVIFFIVFSRGSIDDLKEGHVPQRQHSFLHSPVFCICKERSLPLLRCVSNIINAFFFFFETACLGETGRRALLISLQQFYVI